MNEESGHGVGQVCLNGHPVTGSADRLPEFSQEYCGDCGAKTITTCQGCGESIKGSYWGVLSTEPYKPFNFCHACGAAYPWTMTALEAAKELAAEAEELSEEERAALSRSLDDIIRDTPRTEIAASRFKRLAAKAGQETGNALRQVVVTIATESAKKSLGL